MVGFDSVVPIFLFAAFSAWIGLRADELSRITARATRRLYGETPPEAELRLTIRLIGYGATVLFSLLGLLKLLR